MTVEHQYQSHNTGQSQQCDKPITGPNSYRQIAQSRGKSRVQRVTVFFFNASYWLKNYQSLNEFQSSENYPILRCNKFLALLSIIWLKFPPEERLCICKFS